MTEGMAVKREGKEGMKASESIVELIPTSEETIYSALIKNNHRSNLCKKATDFLNEVMIYIYRFKLH
jgi:hypothetical protein